MSLSTDLFDFALPPELIAQHPCERRDASRLLVVNRRDHAIEHRLFSDLPHFLRAGDTLFRNNAAVLPARLLATRPSGGAVECLLLRADPASPHDTWWCLLKPGRKLPIGATFAIEKKFSARVVEKKADGTALVHFTANGKESVPEIAAQFGVMPLPPYIERSGSAAERADDMERYQTVYADRAKSVAAAAPTAGLHFTPELLRRLQDQGVETAEMTLHVGLGTFKPIGTDRIDEHAMHRERYELPRSTQEKLFSPGGRRIAVGTTSVRSIEDFLRNHDRPQNLEFETETEIFIFPPWRFRGVDAMITNFHQPRSTLLCLVAAFLAPESLDGVAWLHSIYQEAIQKRYRFFSYGDAMLIL